LDVFCGIDWAEGHHDVALIDASGALIAQRRISDDAAGFALLLAMLADAGDSAAEPVPVASETSRGLLAACLRATGRKVFAINPVAVSRYRDRHKVARKKSDAFDALVLANILRTDMAAHRPLPADSELAQAIAVLARVQQDAVWDRTCAHNKLRSLLREYYPAILDAFAAKRHGLLRPEARAIVAAAPTPASAAKLTRTQLQALLKHAGRKRGIAAEAGSRTSGSPPLAPSGPSPPSPPHPAPGPTMTGARPPATGTPPPSATCSAGSSAASTTASRPGSTTTRTSHSRQPATPGRRPPLDNFSAWDVFIG
jgi:transposase